jgi:hypothetical protein
MSPTQNLSNCVKLLTLFIKLNVLYLPDLGWQKSQGREIEHPVMTEFSQHFLTHTHTLFFFFFFKEIRAHAC